LKKRLENIIDFTGDENDYMVFKDLCKQFGGGETPKKVDDALTKMGITRNLMRLDGKPKAVCLGIKDFQNITEEYGDDTSAELSFASTKSAKIALIPQYTNGLSNKTPNRIEILGQKYFREYASLLSHDFRNFTSLGE